MTDSCGRSVSVAERDRRLDDRVNRLLALRVGSVFVAKNKSVEVRRAA
jgi:hypothetical protein